MVTQSVEWSKTRRESEALLRCPAFTGARKQTANKGKAGGPGGGGCGFWN